MRLPVAAALLTLVACSKTTEGPTPKVIGAINPLTRNVTPPRVCNAQGGERGWRMEVAGERFAPMPGDVLTDNPTVAMPEVTLRGPATLTLSRDRVFFVRPELLLLDVPTRDSTPATDLPPGSYAVEVKNPVGGTGSLPDALVVVPPPTVTRVLPPPNGYSFASASPIVIEGTEFQPNTYPAIVLRRAGVPDQPLFVVNVVSPTRIESEIPPGTPEGTYDLVLTNPEGCSFTLPQAITITYARLGTLTLDPRFGWQLRNQAVTLYNAPTGDERTFAAGAPDIFLVAPLKTAPTELVDIPLRRVAVVSPNEVTAVVPTCSGLGAAPITAPECPNGIVPGGPYALRVVDTSGAVGEVPASAGFTVLAEPPPVISSITPGSTEAGGLGSAPLTVLGENFGAGAKVQLLKQLASGNVLACDLPSTGTPTATQLQALVPGTVAATSCVQYTSTGTQVEGNTEALTLAPGLYVVRVQNTTDPAFANYSGLVVTNASANPLVGPRFSTRMGTARADFPLVTATDDLGQPFMYALGGVTREVVDGAGQLRTLSSVEVAQVTLFGDLAGACEGTTCTFRTLASTPLGVGRRLAADGSGTPNATPTPRSGHTAVVRTVKGDTSYLFLIGGVDETGAAQSFVERAQVLRAADAPALAQPATTTEEGATLPAGTFYYRVSALLREDDPKNPGGETLPSDEYSVKNLSTGTVVQLAWPCQPAAARYRVYRTATPDQTSGTEVLLDEVAAPDCAGTPLPQVTWRDTGALQPQDGAPRPLPPGALGRWVRFANGLNVARGQAATQPVGDEVYVTGGFCSTVDANCPGAGASVASLERATFVDDATTGPRLGDFTLLSAGNSLNAARRRHSLAVASATTAPASFASTSPDNRQDVWLVVVGGDQGGAPLNNATAPDAVFEVAKVRDASGLVAAPTFTGIDNRNSANHGGWAYVAANGLFVGGATGGTTAAFRSGNLCPAGNAPVPCANAGSFNDNLNATGLGGSYQDGAARYLNGNVLFRAYIYVAGGFPGDTQLQGATPSATVESLLY
ncbi:hypothetical protein [Myxococcus sp. RHSTA-1-4]|uniref:hypothetical protein n=1 Tax=Myxococcus sp. RHSTA-1-4 TaxID=2874601 RepID=UPI001CBACBFA|nr:hypothetical protein [Myxococcus sp. RHSTA-1-4]MBZ4418345.1 hypothetical protein [Myxococcus sp. RHSTA-1-4]